MNDLVPAYSSVGVARQRGSRWLAPQTEAEPAWKRGFYMLLACVIAGLFYAMLMRFFAPAPGLPGIDENAYLVGGKNMAAHGTPGMTLPTPFSYVGSMWIRTKDGWYYPKYPAGVPLLNAVAIWTGGAQGKFAAFYVSPICAALAVLGMFFLGRAVAGSFMGLMAMIILGGNPTLLWFANVPGSHAPALGFSVWGMVFLLAWWQRGNWWLGILAGFALGYTFTTRYSEGLLVLPLAAAAICTIRWTDWRTYLRAAVPVLAWAAVVGGLLVFNHVGSGHWTGYDSTNESSGFTVEEFMNKWEFTTQQLYMYGLFLVLPLGLMGLALMFQKSWRLGLVMVLWFVPGVILYTAYYWGEQAPGIGYLRFFLTLFPPVIASAMWLLATASQGVAQASGRPQWKRGRIALPVGAGLLTLASAATGVYVGTPSLMVQFVHNENLAFSARQIVNVIPCRAEKGKPVPVVFTDMSSAEKTIFPQLLMYMQFVGDCDWYTPNAFSPKGGGSLGMMVMVGGMQGSGKDNKAVLLDPEQTKFMESVYKDTTRDSLAEKQNELMRTALDAGRPVYAVLRANFVGLFKSRFIKDNFEMKRLARWYDPINLDWEKETQDQSPQQPGRGDRGGSNGLGPAPMQLGWLDSDRGALEVWQIVRKGK